MENFEEIKEKIKYLEKQLHTYKQKLVGVCNHKNIVKCGDHYYNGDYKFVCEDCGMYIITEDPNYGEKIDGRPT